MSPKAKHVLARDHLDLAREEIEEGHLGIAATLLLHAAEAAIDALAERNGIEINPTHWRRGEIVAELNERGIGSSGDGDLIRLLNEERKGYAYDGDEPDFSGDTAEQMAVRVEALVVTAEEAWSGA
jgi:HEPN domain-containing protein